MAINDKNFMGLDGFVWWFGVVENRQDPLGLGRVQVRIYGWHTDSLADIPSVNLPWASVVHAANERAFATPREADVVFGFFADGRSGQTPIVMGIVPGYFTVPPNTGQGFGDLRSQATLVYAPKHPVSRTYNTDGSGITIGEANTGSNTVLESFRHPNADELDQDSITGVARYENLANTVIQARKNNLDKNILSADGFQWSEPYPAYNPLYPYDQATETESGHVFELDDTPGFERIHIAHRSGSYVEWFPTGTKVEKITKSNYQIVMADDYLHVMGKVAITVDADCLIRVSGDVILEGGGDLSANVAGDFDVSVGGAFNVKAQSANFDISGDYSAIAGSIHLTGPTDISGDHVNLESSGDLNLKAGGSGNFEGSSVNMKADGLAAMQGGSVGISGSVLINGLVSVNKGAPGAGGASGADTGSAAGIGAAIGALTKNTGEAAPEEVPVPIPGPFLPDFDPVTGTAYKHQQFLNTSANNTLVSPDSNTANIPTMNCSFDPSSHTFISDSSTWAIGSAGLNLIKQSEGFAKVVSADQVTAYPDPVTGGEPLTIGYGSTAPGIGQPVTLGELISRSTAEGFLEDSVNTNFLPTLRQTITVPLTQNMIDACLDLIYNIGTANFTKSTLRKRINASAWCDAGDAFLVWNKAQGKVIPALTNRRKAERALFLQ
jgi:lysozyme